ncbi:Uncharacterized conserved protein [Rhizobiales bacterium GAS188]|nr:Uncharacterized conserved protein [Rhizobiales bacterium GAS188]
MGNQDRVTRRCALLGATGLLAASGLETSVPLTLASPALAQVAKPKMATEIPPDITTPDRVASRLGTLNFFDGVPDKATCEKVYDNLDFMRGVEVFLNTMAAASTQANFVGLRSVGCDNHTVLIHEDRVDAKTLLLTPNTQTATLWAPLDLKAGPLVVEIPPGVLGLADDHWMRHITDMGLSGPDKGGGGKYVFLPPDYQGQTPDGYFVARSRTFNMTFGLRGFTIKGDTRPAVEAFHKQFKIYPLDQAGNPPPTKIINGSGLYLNTIHASTFKFFEEINQVVQEEPISAVDPEIAGQLAAIGIIKCKPFAPDERMKRILTEAAAVGIATARAIVFRARSDDFYFYPGKSNWRPIFVGGSYLFMQNGAALLDARINFFYQATGVSPAMAAAPVGSGSQYAAAMVDARGNPFDGGKTYRLHLPPNIPAKQFWSLIPYDTQTRSVLQTDQRDAGLSSETGAVATNADGSVDIYFAPTRPRGKENWIQTVPGKSWFVYFRLYSPLEPWCDKSWRPGDIEGLA